MSGDPEQRCYDAFVAAIGDAVRIASPALIADAAIDHQDMLIGLASAHIRGVAATAAAVARVYGRPVEWILGTMIQSLRECTAEMLTVAVSA